ncbi:MAG TPA: hypothetical protein VF292_07915 [Rhodanobacteraceae bacterium]
MIDKNRRRLLKVAALLPAAAVLKVPGGGLAALAQRQTGTHAAGVASFVIDTAQRQRKVSPALASLSYEALQVVGGRYFSARNKDLVALFRTLNPNGVLRVGGNSSDFTVWSGYTGTLPYDPGERGPKKPYVLHPEDIHALAGFLDAVGWKLIFGVNLKIGVPEMAVQLARAVKQAVGDRLLAIQIGNEPDDFRKFHRSYAAYSAAWTPYYKALHAAGLPIGGPDTGGSTDWVIDYAHQHGGQSVLLSRHYYRGGEQDGSIADLLSGAAGFYRQVDEIVRAADAERLPFYITEGNSYWSGGRPGVSNAYASALWGADFLLALAQRGVAGMAFHGGTLQVDQASLGKTVHPEAATSLSARRDAVTAYYGPIAGDPALGFQPAPLFHGLELAQRFAGGQMLASQLDAGGVNLTAYAAVHGDRVIASLINKDATRDATVSIGGLRGYRLSGYERLTGPALDSTSGTRFAAVEHPDAAIAATVAADGVHVVQVLHASAAYLTFQREAAHAA